MTDVESRQVHIELDELSKRAEELGEVLGILEGRLQPVSMSLDEGKAVSGPSDVLCPVADLIRSSRWAIQDAIQKVMGMVNRLEV